MFNADFRLSSSTNVDKLEGNNAWRLWVSVQLFSLFLEKLCTVLWHCHWIVLWLRWSHLSTAVARRKKKSKHFVFNKYFSLVLGVLKSKISKISFDPLLRKLDFNLFHNKARKQPVSKSTPTGSRILCWI